MRDMKNEKFIIGEKFRHEYNNYTPDEQVKERMLDRAYEKASASSIPSFMFSRNIYAIATSAAAVCILFAGIWFMLPQDESVIMPTPQSSGSIQPPDAAATPPPATDNSANINSTPEILEKPKNPAIPPATNNNPFVQSPANTSNTIVSPSRPVNPFVPQATQKPVNPANPIVKPPVFAPVIPPVFKPPVKTLPASQQSTEPPVYGTATNSHKTDDGGFTQTQTQPPPPTTPPPPPTTAPDTDDITNIKPPNSNIVSPPELICKSDCAEGRRDTTTSFPGVGTPPGWGDSKPGDPEKDDDWCGNMNCIVFEKGFPCYCYCKCTIFDLY